jgi:hypothetical protein
MRFAALLALPALLIVLAVCACGSAAPKAPAQSAATACRMFSTWVKDQAGSLDAMENMPLLKAAVKLAPSGPLYTDMDNVLINVRIANTSLGARSVTLPDVQDVQADCSSVNPAS